MRFPHFARPFAATAVAASLVLGACSDSSGPDAPFDPQGTSADAAAVEESFNAPAIESFNATAGYIASAMGGSLSAAVAAAPSAGVAQRSGAIQFGQKVAQLYGTPTSSGPSFATGQIPSEYAGKAFECDVDTDQYAATDRVGAPSNGVRFMLYTVNPVTGQPVEPLDEVGYAQLTVSGSSSSATIQ